MAISATVFGVIFLTINLFMQHTSYKETEHFLQTIAHADGNFMAAPFIPEKKAFNPNINPDFSKKPEMERAVRFFYAKVDTEDNFLEINIDKIYPLTENEAISLVKAVLEKNSTSGKASNMQYIIENKEYGKIIVIAERTIESNLLSSLTRVSFWVALSCFGFIFILSLFLSKWIVNPVKTAFLKQKRFISDASHELKTPLAILSANVDVLENQIGTNTKIKAINEQIERMDLLIKSLVILAKSDENLIISPKNKFDLSHAILKTVLEFESLAFEQDKFFAYDIENLIFYFGNETRIKQLIAILIDNAIKHSPKKAKIFISFKKENNKNIFKVSNSGTSIAKDDLAKVFDRFYRTDDSRSRSTGGYGLGLSIAKSIAKEHKTEILLSSKNNKVSFSIEL